MIKIHSLNCVVATICFLVSIVAVSSKNCERCIPVDECSLFKDMSKQEQKDMLMKFPCQTKDHTSAPYGFAPIAKGDYICCPAENVWGIENPEKPQITANYQRADDNQPQHNDHDNYGNDQINRRPNNNEDQFDYSQRPRNGQHDHTIQDEHLKADSNGNSGADIYEQNRIPSRRHHNNNIFNGQNSNRRNNFNGNLPNYNSQNTFYPNSNGFGGNVPIFNGQNVNRPNFNKQNGNIPNFNGQNGNFLNSDRSNSNNPNYNGPNDNVPAFNGFNNNYFPNSNTNNVQNQRPFNGNSNSFGTNLGGQCKALSSFPPAHETGCCGRDLSASNRITGPSNGYFNRQARYSNDWSPNSPRRRFSRSTENEKVNITLDTRITGGRETELEQFPWTVLLKTTFDYGNKKASFNCGGSLISARYVLTAAHCVTEEGARISDVDIYLSEYDKRTFPQDCVHVPGEGKKCIENVVMKAEGVVPHAQYDDIRLQNDIALIRLRGNAPYTGFIRPICLPPIDIDDPEYSDLRLAVAGWGRDGRYTSQVKQSTVVNLVPQDECVKSYPHLTRKHLCAAGHSGEDTCKGDSGGPLMMLYGGTYFVSGVVSGKRADSPCGTTVPSLYTNVYHYVDWIRSNISN